MKHLLKIRLYFSLVLLLLLLVNVGASQNPLVKGIGMSDPHIRVYNDTLYLYCGHDSSPMDKLWVMKEWRVFKSSDLTNWKQVGQISTADNYMPDNSQDCWASDGAYRNGNYYFYFSDQKRSIGVMKSDSPEGPFTDALGKPLVAPMHDPTLFVDDNEAQTPYLVYGDKSGGGYHIAQLNEDMISLTETPKPIIINGEEWKLAPKWMDKNYLFKYNGIYYLSWGRDYAISKNIYGPYESVGAVGNGHNLDQLAHGSFFWWKGQFYHSWCYYIKKGFKYRETIISYCHFSDDGKIVTDTNFLNKHFANGVGSYNSNWDKIEAEWFYEKSANIEKRDCKFGGFELSNIENGSWVSFAKVAFETKPKTFVANITNISGGGSIEIRQDSLSGKLLGTVTIPKNINSQNQNTVNCSLEEITGQKDIYLQFVSENEKLFNLNWIKFN